MAKTVDKVIEQIVWGVSHNSLVVIKERLANENKKILKSHENSDGEMRAVGPRVIEPLAEIVQALPELEQWALGIVKSLSESRIALFARGYALKDIAKMVQENPQVSKTGFELVLQVIASGITGIEDGNAVQSIAEIVKVDSSLANLSLPHIKKLNSGSGHKGFNAFVIIAKVAPHLAGEMFEQVKIYVNEGGAYQIKAVKAAAKIVKVDPSLAHDALNLCRTVDLISDRQELAKVIAKIVKAAPDVVNEAFELLNLEFEQCGYDEIGSIILDIVKAVPELAHNALDLLAKSLLGKDGYHSVLYNIEALKTMAEIVKAAPNVAYEAFEMTRKLLKIDNNAREGLRTERGKAEEALKTLAAIVKVEQSLADAAFNELMQEKPLFGSFVVASTTCAIAEIVTIKPPLASVALNILIPALDNKNLHYNKKIVAASVAKMVQADPLVAIEVLKLVKPLFDKGQSDVAVEITVSVVEVVPNLADEVVETIKVLLTSGSGYNEHSAKELLKAMPWLCKGVIKQVEQLEDKEAIKDILKKIQPIYEQYVEYVKGVGAQVQEHLALGYLGVDKAPHVTKALGVIDEYVTFGEVEVV